MAIGRDRNLAVHIYRGEIAARLAAHAQLLHRWLAALQQHATAGD